MGGAGRFDDSLARSKFDGGIAVVALLCPSSCAAAVSAAGRPAGCAEDRRCPSADRATRLLHGNTVPARPLRVAASAPHLVPWAWGVNGCASVLSAILATLLAMSIGFTWVVLIAMALYIVAAVTFRPPLAGSVPDRETFWIRCCAYQRSPRPAVESQAAVEQIIRQVV